LKELNCDYNYITKIESLPLGLTYFNVSYNPIEYVDDVKYSDIKFTLRGYQAIRRIQKRMKRRYKIKNRASQLIGRVALNWLHSAPNGPMFKRNWRELNYI
jgi:hypothetical protein